MKLTKLFDVAKIKVVPMQIEILAVALLSGKHLV
jgi:hypothetical protein